SPPDPRVPFPATVEITPSALTRRTRLLSVSAIKNPPSGNTATPVGNCRLAFVAGPPSPPDPRRPFPATLLLAPPAQPRRTRLVCVSGIKNPPSGNTATPNGRLRLALVAGPPSPPDPVTFPATVKIFPLNEFATAPVTATNKNTDTEKTAQ